MIAKSLNDILSLSRTCYRANVSSKKKCLELVAQTIAGEFPQIQPNCIFDALIDRERLGSTGVGHGCAIPHCRLETTEHAIGALILLNDPIDFDSPDKIPVDIIFALTVPKEAQEQHLQLLSTIAGKLSSASFRDKLRQTSQREMLYQEATTL